MLSVLIPVYNYKIVNLVSNLHKQLINSGIAFEIIALDDKSEEEFTTANKSINELTHSSYLIAKKNNGIAITRHNLCKQAVYNWVLLLDADVEIASKNYITNYVKHINKEHKAVFGGFIYKDNLPNSTCLLRWKYGKTYEAISATERNKKPYKVTIAANLLIDKKTFLDLELYKMGNNYGMDLLFGPKLKANNIGILHIDNGVYHLGIEENNSYLKKTKKAVETLHDLWKNNAIDTHENTLLSTFLKGKKIGLNSIWNLFYKFFNKLLHKQLSSTSPNLYLFQLYKLFYLSYYNKNKY